MPTREGVTKASTRVHRRDTVSITSTGASRFGRIRDAEARCGLKRGTLYKLATANPGLFKKAGNATIVDLNLLDQVLAGLPAADLGDKSSA
jgi:hypothetical protein